MGHERNAAAITSGIALAIALGAWSGYPQAKPPAVNAAEGTPSFAVDPYWPKPLPDNWVTGEIGGTCIDSQDHVFVVTRGFQNGGLASPEGVGGANTHTAQISPSKASPPVIEFDQEGNVVHSWGNPAHVPAGQPNANQNAVLPNGIHGCFVDYQDNVWIAGNGDGVVQKWSHDGTAMLLQIGQKFTCDDGLGGSIPCVNPGTTGGADNGFGNVMRTGISHTLLNLPADIAVDGLRDPARGTVTSGDARWAGYEMLAGRWYTKPGEAVATTGFPAATAVSGTWMGSKNATISARRFSNHGGMWSLVPSSSLVSSFSNDPGALQQLSTRIPPGHRQYME